MDGKAADLVLHERDQRVDDDRQSREQETSELIDQGLPRASGQKYHCIAAVEEFVDRLELTGAEARLREEALQETEQWFLSVLSPKNRLHPRTCSPDARGRERDGKNSGPDDYRWHTISECGRKVVQR